jgi:Family of unknown function (DUF5681)
MAANAGYGHPPQHSRWKKGQSGNPRGRPRGGKRDVGDELLAELGELIQITEGGRTRSITKLQALFKSLTARGIKGDTRAASLVLTWWARKIAANPQAEPDLSAEDRKIVEEYLDRQVELRLAKRKGDE